MHIASDPYIILFTLYVPKTEQVRLGLRLLRQLPRQPCVPTLLASNQWIHIITVPIIACTLFALISYIPLTYQLDGWTVGMDTVLLPLLVLIYLRVDLLYGVIVRLLRS